VHLRAADVLQSRELLGPELGTQVARPEGDAAEEAALLASAVVGEYEHDRVLSQARALEEGDKAGELTVGVVEHASERRLQA